MSIVSPLTPEQVDGIVAKFKQRFGQEPDGIHLVGSHAEGRATIASDIDIVIETNLPLTKFHGPGFDFFKDINPGKVPPVSSALDPVPGRR
jgi:predicted nucleotidyltransferase